MRCFHEERPESMGSLTGEAFKVSEGALPPTGAGNSEKLTMFSGPQVAPISLNLAKEKRDKATRSQRAPRLSAASK
jgi:hypothetical protein